MAKVLKANVVSRLIAVDWSIIESTRRSLKISQSQLAELLDKSTERSIRQSTLGAWKKSGKFAEDLVNILAETLGLDTNEVLIEKDQGAVVVSKELLAAAAECDREVTLNDLLFLVNLQAQLSGSIGAEDVSRLLSLK